MSLVETFYEPLIENDIEKVRKSSARGRVQDIIKGLLSKNSDLLVQVELGKTELSVLETEIIKLLDQQGGIFDRQVLIKEILDEMFGYGQLQKYLEDEEISDIIGTRYDTFFAKKNGIVSPLPVQFEDVFDFENYCKLLVIRNGGIINENDNHARVADESLRLRINVTIPPRAVNGPMIVIRKHRKQSWSLEALRHQGMLDETAHELLKQLLQNASRFLICGKGAAGKTTLLRALLNDIGDSERILICESDTELYPESPTMVGQRIIQREGFGKTVTLEDLIKDGLTMSLDGYCIGEITGVEAWSFVKAGYTDHRIFGTLHSNCAEDVPDRLLMMSHITQMGMSETLAKKMICQSLDYIVYMKAFKIEKIIQCQGMDTLNNEPIFATLYTRCEVHS